MTLGQESLRGNRLFFTFSTQDFGQKLSYKIFLSSKQINLFVS